MWVIGNATLRRVLRVGIPLVGIPAILLVGGMLTRTVQNPARYYPLLTMGVTVLALLLFLTGFARRQTGARRMVVVAVLTVLAVAGRFLPLLKPVTAIAILAALYLGGEAGFLVGALSALLSNFAFGQGPWTPFQMAAWGMTGLLAGLLAKPLLRSRVLLLLYGALAGLLFSMLMDIWTVLWETGGFSPEAYRLALLTALPHTLLYAAGNVLFLALLAKPLGEKLRRLQVKFGI